MVVGREGGSTRCRVEGQEAVRQAFLNVPTL